MSAHGLSLCVIVRNGAAALPECLRAVRDRRAAFSDVVLVDDASTDGSAEVAVTVLPDVHVVRLPHSVGPGGARNAGLRATRARRVLFIDSDVILDVGCPDALMEAACTHEAAVVVPAVVWAERPDEVQFDGAGTHFLGLMALKHAGADVRELPSAPLEIGGFSTPCFLLDRSLWTEPELFDPSFLFNLEDHDLSLRARLQGLRLLSVPAARVRHGGGTRGFSVRGVAPPPPIRTYCLIRNRWRIVMTCYQLRTLLVLAPMLVVYEVFQLAGAVRRGWVGTWLRAAGWMFRHLPEVVEKRRRIQRSRVLSDGAVLEGGPLPFRPELARGPLERAALEFLGRLANGWWALARPLVP